MKNFIHDPHDSTSPIHVLKGDNLSWCGLLYAFWEEVSDEKLQATAKHCVKCHQNWQGVEPPVAPLVKDKYVLVSVMGQVLNWQYVSADFMLDETAGTLRYEEVKAFLENEIGSFIPFDGKLLFKVTPN